MSYGLRGTIKQSGRRVQVTAIEDGLWGRTNYQVRSLHGCGDTETIDWMCPPRWIRADSLIPDTEKEGSQSKPESTSKPKPVDKPAWEFDRVTTLKGEFDYIEKFTGKRRTATIGADSKNLVIKAECGDVFEATLAELTKFDMLFDWLLQINADSRELALEALADITSEMSVIEKMP